MPPAFPFGEQQNLISGKPIGGVGRQTNSHLFGFFEIYPALID
jgi:hypothetical protein